jgi:hypothetical protein
VTPEEFLDELPEPRRSELVQLDAVIRAALARTVQGGMLGYGPYRYRHPSGGEGDTCVVSLASAWHGVGSCWGARGWPWRAFWQISGKPGRGASMDLIPPGPCLRRKSERGVTSDIGKASQLSQKGFGTSLSCEGLRPHLRRSIINSHN